MEFNKVNFSVIEECLGQCESKEAIFELFRAAASCKLDSEIRTLKSDELPQTLKQLPNNL